MSVLDGVLRKGRHMSQCSDAYSQLLAGDKIASCHTRKKYEVIDIGLMHPEEESTGSLQPGQVGYIACNMKESSEGE